MGDDDDLGLGHNADHLTAVTERRPEGSVRTCSQEGSARNSAGPRAVGWCIGETMLDPATQAARSHLRLWRRLPLALRAILSGLFVFQAIQFGWTASFMANTRFLPAVPWNVAVGLVYWCVAFRYFNGRWWPASTAEARRTAMRARRLSPREWRLSLLYCLACLVFIASIINVVYRFIEVPSEPMDLSMLPWWTLYPSLIMLSINAGISEEAGFRGYMQGGLERRYGPAVAIATTSILFWLAHLNHANGMARWALLIAYGAAVGAVAWAADSIWPAIVSHALVDAVSFVTVAGDFGPDWFMKKPAPFAKTGVDGPFVVFSLLLALSVLTGIDLLRRLRRSRTRNRAA